MPRYNINAEIQVASHVMLSLPLYSIIKNWTYHLYNEAKGIKFLTLPTKTRRRDILFIWILLCRHLDVFLIFVLLLLCRHLDVFWFLVVFAFVERRARYFTFCRLLSWEIIDLSIGVQTYPRSLFLGVHFWEQMQASTPRKGSIWWSFSTSVGTTTWTWAQ